MFLELVLSQFDLLQPCFGHVMDDVMNHVYINVSKCLDLFRILQNSSEFGFGLRSPSYFSIEN